LNYPTKNNQKTILKDIVIIGANRAALVALTKRRETHRPEKAVRVSNVEPTIHLVDSTSPLTLLMFSVSNTFLRMSTTLPLSFLLLLNKAFTPEYILLTSLSCTNGV